MEHFVIIGNGIAALSAAEAIRRIDGETPVTMVSEEPYHTYYRTQLSHLLGEDPIAENLLVHKPEWYIEKNIKVLLNHRVTGIDFAQQNITLDDGIVLEYSKLLLAMGSYPFIPSIVGTNLNGVFTIRTLNDTKKIYDYIKDKKTGAIIGGGVLGLEAAWALANKGKKIYVIENSAYIMVKQLDKNAAEIIQSMGEKAGISFIVSAQLKKINGEQSVSSIDINGSSAIPVDFVIFSTGVRSNVALLKDSPINANRGIVVDQHMKTNIENVYAAGDVAEYNGYSYGIWPVAREQGKVAGTNMAGEEILYSEIVPSNYVKVFGVDIFSAGDLCNDGSYQFAVEDTDKSKSIYKKVFFKNNMPVGAILVGDTKEANNISKAIKEKITMDDDFIKNPTFVSFIESINKIRKERP
ncbi:nitrite reductase (NADH) large subunit [Caldanaerobius fijiensis DSM 17918]|uniref:Nitrite reductase (NADH) large subunit n=1 Tax=Caldanaerobius fijiensis DSM 17918 TaxID=1121256 RepID=A0A1M4X886_9THEO|nr:FAD-dependent oxidoreductase [Caldanaerobius fijiensis]SHE89605.1 nitrite reductase (NADH) large subunit [Caldanaerobius fijiensis DSM 17918]